MARLPVYKLADIPREKNLHEGRMTRYSIRTVGSPGTELEFAL